MSFDSNVMTTTEDAQSVARQEYEKIQREVNEVKLLVRQTTTEVEKLTQRRAVAASKLREMEQNLETYGRQEIRALYASTQEAEMRLFMMNSQLEQLQAKQRFLERYANFSQRMLELIPLQRIGTGPLPRTVAEPEPTVSNQPLDHLEIVSRVFEAREDERQRIARRIHDGPAQALSNLILRSEICQRLLNIDEAQAKTELGSLKGMVNQTLQSTRAFIFDLRPMILDDLGLGPSIKRYATDLGAKNNLPVIYQGDGDGQRYNTPTEIAVFRIVQEAVINAITHAKATKITITATYLLDSIHVIVEDDGHGYDEHQAHMTNPSGGLHEMRQRAEMLRAELVTTTAPGKGTTVEVTVPV